RKAWSGALGLSLRRCAQTRRKRSPTESSHMLNVQGRGTAENSAMCPAREKSITGSTWMAALLLLLLCFGFCSSSVSALDETKNGWKELFVNHRAARFVAVNGNDSGPGTADRPWATINHAAEHAVAGDTVIVRVETWQLCQSMSPVKATG